LQAVAQFRPQRSQCVHAFTRLDEIGARGPGLDPATAQKSRWLPVTNGLATPGRREQVIPRQRDVIPQQLEPVGDAAGAEHAAQARRIPTADGAAAKTPEAERPEPEHDELAFPGQHAVGFADHGIGIGFEFQRMRQDHGIDTGVGDRQLGQPRNDVRVSGFHPGIGNDGVTSRPTTGQEAGTRSPGAKLKQLPAENIVQGFGHELGLGQ
jgi:hypothetical protein